MSKILQVSNLHKKFADANRTIQILRGVELEMEAGESVAIIGKSGAGKSTLLHILGGLSKPTKGKVLFHGKNIHAQKPAQICDWRNRNLGFVFQSHHLLTDFNARENVCIPALVAGENRKIALEKADEILIRLGLKERLEHKTVNLSGGEQQRVAIARALVNSPEYILADEPTGNLDESTGREVGELLTELCKTRKTALLVVTHNQSLASRMDRCLNLSDGIFHLQKSPA